MLAGVAGVALVGLGALVLWRSRRLDERPLRRYARRALVARRRVVAVSSSCFRSAIAIVATHRAREPVEAVDLGRPYERVTLHDVPTGCGSQAGTCRRATAPR